MAGHQWQLRYDWTDDTHAPADTDDAADSDRAAESADA
jgi:hypothetical protein